MASSIEFVVSRSANFSIRPTSVWRERRRGGIMDKSAVVRRQRAEATRRWRQRLDRGAAVYPVEVDGETFALMERLAARPSAG